MAADAHIKAVISAEDNASRVLSGFGSSVSTLAKTAAVAVTAAAAATVAFGVLSVKAYTESENALTQLNAVLKSTNGIAGVTADQATNLAKALQKTTKFSDEEVLSAENLLLTFTAIGKDIFPQATETVLNMATALGEDTKSASIQLGKALQDPILGVTALRRVGVNFSDAQKDVIKNLVETGRKAEAQKLILKELQVEFGGSAEAAGNTFSGALAKLKNNFNDVEESVGKVIVNALVPLTSKLADVLGKIDWEAVISSTVRALSTFWAWITKVKDVVVEIGTKVYNFLKPSLDALKNTITDQMPQLKEYWNNVLKPLLIIIGVTLVAAIWLLINALNVSIKIWKGVMDVIEAVRKSFVDWWHTVNGAWQAIVNLFVTGWALITQGAVQTFNIIMAYFKPFIDFIMFWFNTMYALVVLTWQSIYNIAIKPIIDLIAANINWLAGVINNAWQSILDFVRPIWGAIVGVVVVAWNAIYGVWAGVGGWFMGLFNTVGQAGMSAANNIMVFFNHLWDSIVGGATGALNWLVDKLNEAIGAYNNTIGKVPGAPNISSLPHFATGVQNFGGGMAVVGENGPEVVALPGGSSVIPHGGGAGGAVNITIQAGAFMGSQQDARKYAQMIASAMKDVATMNGTTPAAMLGGM